MPARAGIAKGCRAAFSSPARLLELISDIGTAQVINAVALPGDAPAPPGGTLPFYVTDPFWSSSLARPDGHDGPVCDVPAVRLSELVAEHRPDVIACDIEGGEADLFGSSDLSGVRHVMMELHTRVYGGEGIRRTFEGMHRQGFFYHQKHSAADIVVFERLK